MAMKRSIDIECYEDSRSRAMERLAIAKLFSNYCFSRQFSYTVQSADLSCCLPRVLFRRLFRVALAIRSRALLAV